MAARTLELVCQLNKIVVELEEMHPGRKFTLDGHLVGSIGEAAAAALLELELVRASSAGHDAVTPDGRKVEIKATYGNSGVGVRATSDAAQVLVVLKLSRSGDPHEVVFNGPMALAKQVAGRTQSNGQARMSLARLRGLDADVDPKDGVPRRSPGEAKAVRATERWPTTRRGR